jgi:hypothetical protein
MTMTVGSLNLAIGSVDHKFSLLISADLASGLLRVTLGVIMATASASTAFAYIPTSFGIRNYVVTFSRHIYLIDCGR